MNVRSRVSTRTVHVHRASSIITSAAICFTTILFTTNSAVESTYIAEFTISWYYIYSNTFIGTSEIHLLQHCHHLVRVCFGCQQALKPGNGVPDPPNDLTIVSRMPRSLRLSNREMVNRQGNVYFHVYRNCVLVKQPYFQPSMVNVSQFVLPHLTPAHFHFLRTFGLRI